MYGHTSPATASIQTSTGVVPLNPNTSENSEVPLIVTEENAPPQPGPTMQISHVIKSLIQFLSQEMTQPLWNYEDITAKGEGTDRFDFLIPYSI